MVMQIEPFANCIEMLKAERVYDEVIFMSPDGETLNQTIANELSIKGNIIILCGHYKGIDQRIRDIYVTREISIGDYVLNGGEVAALAMIEAITRLIPGFMGNAESIIEESHSDGLLEYPSYTKPAVWRDLEVPDVLLSGNHALIAKWRKDQQIERTKRVRPDLLPD